jgi:hypothetical protein
MNQNLKMLFKGGPYTNLHWSTGETTPSIDANAATTTEYSVTGTDGVGCPFTAAPHTVTVMPSYTTAYSNYFIRLCM